MIANDDEPFEAMLRKLDTLAKMDEADRSAIKALPFTVLSAEAGEYLVRERQYETSCCILLSGYACRHKATVRGDRQIVSFHIPGDVLDVWTLLYAVADHNIQTITAARYLVVPSQDLKRVAEARRNVADALWRDSLIDASVFRQWVLNVGRRDAKSRIAHMLCEFATRCALADSGRTDRFEFPLTQADIGDATGLSAVHVSRTLAGMVAERLITCERGMVRVADWGALCGAAAFDPTYLHAAA
jgi:CRP-like cAMP-binding protein|uniref:Crp/Fnr family transcriptional regulator n=1 Tax=uncultured Sphingomonas sp. TaxID=158754 RepID=UPI0035C9757C